jgi:hypothetical protein
MTANEILEGLYVADSCQRIGVYGEFWNHNPFEGWEWFYDFEPDNQNRP